MNLKESIFRFSDRKQNLYKILEQNSFKNPILNYLKPMSLDQSNSSDKTPPTANPERAGFISEIGKIFSGLFNIFCCQRSSTHKENLHAMPHSDKKKFKVEIQKVKDDFMIPLDFDQTEKDQLLISHLFLRSLKESFEDDSITSPDKRFDKFKNKFKELCDMHYNNYHMNDDSFVKIEINENYDQKFQKYFTQNHLNEYKINNEHEHILLFQYDFLKQDDKEQIKNYINHQLSKFDTTTEKKAETPELDLNKIEFDNFPTTIISKAISAIIDFPKIFEAKAM